MGYRTLVKKECPVVFKVRNIAPENKTVRLFFVPIKYGHIKDLLDIPNVSEDVIRHSLLKGDLNVKIRGGEIEVADSNIELLQFDECQKQFLIDAGVIKGVDPNTLGPGGGGETPFAFKQGIQLIGELNDNNRVFKVPSPDKFINGNFGNNEFRILIKHNGRDLVEGIDYFVAESDGVGTGLDTIILTSLTPKPRSLLVADYVIEVILN
jgi:hypothetical protein